FGRAGKRLLHVRQMPAQSLRIADGMILDREGEHGAVGAANGNVIEIVVVGTESRRSQQLREVLARRDSVVMLQCANDLGSRSEGRSLVSAGLVVASLGGCEDLTVRSQLVLHDRADLAQALDPHDR